MSLQIIIPSSEISSQAKAGLFAPRGICAQAVQEGSLEQGEILQGVVLPHRDLEHSMQLVLDLPVRANHLSQLGQCEIARADFQKVECQPNYLIRVWQPWIIIDF